MPRLQVGSYATFGYNNGAMLRDEYEMVLLSLVLRVFQRGVTCLVP